MINKKTVGTCGNCGGAVQVPMIFYSVVPPRPQCSSCHAYAAEDHGPVIPMEPVPRIDVKKVAKALGAEHRGTSNKWYELVVSPIFGETTVTRFPINTNKSQLNNQR